MWCKSTAFAQQYMSDSHCDRGNAIVESKRKWRIPEWVELEEHQRNRICSHREDTNPFDESDWPQQFEWFTTKLERFNVRVFDTYGIRAAQLGLTLRNCGLNKRMHFSNSYYAFVFCSFQKSRMLHVSEP